MNKKVTFIIILIAFLSLFINLYNKNSSPPCFNADEAAFGYNAYSLLKTGKDEYGVSLPLRLKSFGDYKMPLYSYLSVPLIALGGLNETSTRTLNTIISFLFPIVIFFLTKQLFQKNRYGIIAAFLFALSPGIQTIGRQAHESYLTTFTIALSLWLLIRYIQKPNRTSMVIFFLSLLPLSFGYQFSRLWIGLFFIISVIYSIRKKISLYFPILFTIVFLILLIPDILMRPARVNNLLFFNNIGLGLQTAELRSEGGTRLLYNKATVGLKNFLFSHLSYFSPQFLVLRGDENYRFGYDGISPITLVEYIFIFVGLYYLFKEKHGWRYIILLSLLFSPLASSLSWAGYSITRALPLILFINILCAYGVVQTFTDISKKKIFGKFILLMMFIPYAIFCFYSWDFYYNHYPKRAITIRAWQCGNREMAQYVKTNYKNTDAFYITKKNSQPYIFLLFYLSYPPEKYQQQAQLSSPDVFGFGQVENFDKFVFQFQDNTNKNKAVYIGYPDDFNTDVLRSKDYDTIKVGTEEIFYILKTISL